MKKILLVEDDQLLSDLYKEILEDEGYQVTIAPDGKEGYQKAREGAYDLVLLDIMLPKMDGLDILRKLKQEKKLKNIKTIFLLTNLSGKSVARKKGRIHVDEYLIKSSMTPDQLIEKVNNYLKKED